MPTNNEQVGNPQPLGFIYPATFAPPLSQSNTMQENFTMADTSKEVELRIQVSEANTDAKLARLEGKIDVISANLSNFSANIISAIEAQKTVVHTSKTEITDAIKAQKADAAANRNIIIVTIVGASLTLAGIFYAALSYGAAQFYNGTVVRDIVKSETEKAKPASASTPSTGAIQGHSTPPQSP